MLGDVSSSDSETLSWQCANVKGSIYMSTLCKLKLHYLNRKFSLITKKHGPRAGLVFTMSNLI